LNTKIYADRREILKKSVYSGMIVLFGNNPQPRNYPSNILPFRQDSHFLYYAGINRPGLICCIDCDSGVETLFGNASTVEDSIWSGDQVPLAELAKEAGFRSVLPMAKFPLFIEQGSQKGQKIHYLPPYPADRLLFLSRIMKLQPDDLKSSVSVELIQSIVKQRSCKTGEEIGEIEWALENITAPMHITAMKMASPGNHESHIVAEMLKIVHHHHAQPAYPVICSIRGEILHNESYLNILQKDNLLLVDAGSESLKHYASDITRTSPVGGKFSSLQRDIYELVLSAQQRSIHEMKPGIFFRDIHLNAAKILAEGLKDLGLMKGNAEEAVHAGAHALFFPHGLGHMLGLDVHDMEDLGEDFVGYDPSVRRSKQFGMAYLRFARQLKPGFVLTVEPGVYFIPALIDLWQSQKKFSEFISYNKLKSYRDFGGIRIEDNILITDDGHRLLGPRIPKTCKELEDICGQ
jgi:Xaa-Pro aminopeptidase